MKIAIMMRPMDQDSGFRTIMEGLIENMLKIDDKNTYLLLYRKDKWLGRFADFENAEEILVEAPHKLAWDQIAVSYRAWKEKADIIYNPKFSVPFISHCPVVMGLHEPAWWAWPEHYEWLDKQYIKLMLPLYCRKAAHMFPISDFVIHENRKYLGLAFDNTTVAYPAPAEIFRTLEDTEVLERVRDKYQLPQRFVFSVTRVDHPGVEGSTSFFDGKNPETTLKAFIMCREKIPHHLVFAGRSVREYMLHLGFNSDDFEKVHFLGFLPLEELPMLYNLAELFVIPSYYESYGCALVEAMSCGCPVIAADSGACPEISGGAALLADPYNPNDFADKMLAILTDGNLGRELSSKSLERASFFNWEKTARVTIDVMSRVVENRSK